MSGRAQQQEHHHHQRARGRPAPRGCLRVAAQLLQQRQRRRQRPLAPSFAPRQRQPPPWPSPLPPALSAQLPPQPHVPPPPSAHARAPQQPARLLHRLRPAALALAPRQRPLPPRALPAAGREGLASGRGRPRPCGLHCVPQLPPPEYHCAKNRPHAQVMRRGDSHPLMPLCHRSQTPTMQAGRVALLGERQVERRRRPQKREVVVGGTLHFYAGQ